ncbi:trypsin-1-like [Drosophila rhopaloa]|uniref:Peptidase S1 domain-containing protein n=2 Tax=Drosophila rhopaloa TaxID=1041015 RepID=A0ABM5J0Y9_DRORH|nr:trypsin-1-like [Drosophila rhopaloa]
MLQTVCLLFLVIIPWSASGAPDKCGIVGEQVMIKDVPWMASIRFDKRIICNGVILNTKYILTTSNCMRKRALSRLKLSVGSSSRGTGGTEVGVCKVTYHPQVGKKNFGSNLALMNLCEALKLTDSIKEIQVIDKEPDLKAKATTSGWSTIMWGASLREPCETVSAYVLRKLDVNLHDPNSCSKDRKRWFNISSGDTVQNICVTRKTESCSFDKGAPMVIDGKLAGILALGDCSKEPEVFINLFHHKAWLESNSKDK